MTSRQDGVIEMQLALIPIMMKNWQLSGIELQQLMVKYNILHHIDLAYEKYNSTGIKGIMTDIENYIRMLGGTVKEYRYENKDPFVQELMDEKAKMLAGYIREKHKISWEKAILKMTGTLTYRNLLNEKSKYVYESDNFIKHKYDLEASGNLEEFLKR